MIHRTPGDAHSLGWAKGPQHDCLIFYICQKNNEQL